jgi:isoleucyl-tRNA synthetase
MSDDTAPRDDADAAQVDALRGTGLLLRVDGHDRTVELCGACGGRVRDADEREWAAATSHVADQLATERAAVTRHSLTGTTPAAPSDGPDLVMSRRAAHGIPLPLWRCDACHHVTAVSGRARLATLAGCDADTLDAHDGSIEAATFSCRACSDGMARHVGLVTDACVLRTIAWYSGLSAMRLATSTCSSSDSSPSTKGWSSPTSSA